MSVSPIDPFVDLPSLPRSTAVNQVVVTTTLPQGERGPVGPTGPAGLPGSQWYVGYGPPTQTSPQGYAIGDLYLNDENGDVWKWFGAWHLEGNIRGPIGVRGPTGATGSQGIPGATGPQGETGGAIWIKGSIDDPSQLPPTGELGDGWIQNDNGHLWIWDGASWVDVGPIQGPAGKIPVVSIPWRTDTTDYLYSIMIVNVDTEPEFAVTDATEPSVRLLLPAADADGGYLDAGVPGVRYRIKPGSSNEHEVMVYVITEMLNPNMTVVFQ